MFSSAELARLWKAHAPSLVILASRHCDSPEDCVQEAFVRLATEKPPPEFPVAWLVRVVRNEAISQTRSGIRRRQREINRRQTYFHVNCESEAIDQVDAGTIVGLLDELSADERDVVIARIWHGLTFRQIAESFHFSKATAHRYYEAGLDYLRRRMKSAAVERKEQ